MRITDKKRAEQIKKLMGYNTDKINCSCCTYAEGCDTMFRLTCTFWPGFEIEVEELGRCNGFKKKINDEHLCNPAFVNKRKRSI